MTKSRLQFLTDVAIQAGEIALGYWQNAPRFWHKDDDAGPVSEADLDVNAYLEETLLGQFPDYGWLSEETADTSDRLTKEHVIVVDPIDGTRSFIAGEQSWGISVAIVRSGQPTHGVVHMPALDKTYSAKIDKGAFFNGAQVFANDPAHVAGARALGAKPNFRPELWRDGIVPDLSRHFRPSLAYRAALVAEGRFDAMLTCRHSWEWDLAAGTLIAREAGAIVTDWFGGTAKFNNPTPKLNGMMIAGPQLHQALQQLRVNP